MKLSLHDTTRTAFVPLRDAVLCLDCQFITPPGSNICSVCGGRMLVNVAQILGILLEEAPVPSSPSMLAGKPESRLCVIDSGPSRMRRLRRKKQQL